MATRDELVRSLRPLVTRYLPLEVAGTVTALAAGLLAYATTASLVVAALAASWAEAVGFYGCALVRGTCRGPATAAGARGSRLRRTGRELRDMLLEFGPAEVLDTAVVRPAAMWAGAVLTGAVVPGLLVGKVAADVVFYAVAATALHLLVPAGRSRADERGQLTGRSQPTGPSPAAGPDLPPAVAPRDLPAGVSTPYLLLDLDEVERCYEDLHAGLGRDVALHYAVKANPDPRLLMRLQRCGSRFEIASVAELDLLLSLGVDPAALLFSHPVKREWDIRAAAAAGVWRFAFDGHEELRKLASAAPGSAVYVRLRCAGAGGAVGSEGKFGVEPSVAVELLRRAADLGLRPYGIAFHVGSQTTDPTAWERPVRESGAVMAALARHGIRLEMLDVGGGFPAPYEGVRPAPPEEYGAALRAACRRHLPYDVALVAEPGRALCASAGTMVATVIGVADRAGERWVHLDVGALNGLVEALESGATLPFPVRDLRGGTPVRSHVTGPTCDSQDTVRHDATLSSCVQAGDRVLVSTAGAYSVCCASRFNGYDVPRVVYARDRLPQPRRSGGLPAQRA